VGTDGTVTGVAGGTARISYIVTNGCGTASTSTIVTVNAFTAGTISGPSSLTTGTTISLTDAVTGGTWSASNGNATVGSTGIVTGVSAGTATVVFTSNAGCTASADVTVNALPTVAAISGASSVCVGSTITLSDATGSGVWSSVSGVASVDGSGNVLGVSQGSTTISYTVTNGAGCSVASTMNVTVVILPTVNAITGSASTFVGSFVNLTDATPGGVWSSTNTSAATVGSTGHVVGVAPGTTTISYTVSNACGPVAAEMTFTVSAPPSSFTKGKLVIYRVGDGVTTLSSTAISGSLIEYATDGAPTGMVVNMPTSGAYSFVNSGSATSEGMMSLSVEKDRLILGGYNAAVGTLTVASTPSASVARELVAARSDGSISLVASTSSLISGNNIRGGTAVGNTYYAAGAANGILAFAHITGGGFPDNIPRVFPDGIGAVLDLEQIPVLPVFKWLAKTGGVSADEMLRTFNCGIGMVVVARNAQRHDVINALIAVGESPVEIGHITKHHTNKPRITYSGTLQL
jgi:uncharacterized protein YjdB